MSGKEWVVGGGIALLGLALILVGAAPADAVPGSVPSGADETYVDSVLANLGTACFLFAPLYVVQQRIALRNRVLAVERSIDIQREKEVTREGWPYQTPVELSALLTAGGWTAEGVLDGHLVWSKKNRYQAFALPPAGAKKVVPVQVAWVGTAMGLNVDNFDDAVRQLRDQVEAVTNGDLTEVVPAHDESTPNRRIDPVQAWQAWRRNRRLRRELPRRVFGSVRS